VQPHTFEFCAVCGRVAHSSLCSGRCRSEAARRLARNARRLRRLQDDDESEQRQRLALANGWLLSAIWRYDKTA
jgi:hypothetical protein